MKKYYAIVFSHPTADQDGRPGDEVYLASDVDARIAELEGVLREVVGDVANSIRRGTSERYVKVQRLLGNI